MMKLFAPERKILLQMMSEQIFSLLFSFKYCEKITVFIQNFEIKNLSVKQFLLVLTSILLVCKRHQRSFKFHSLRARIQGQYMHFFVPFNI